MNIISELLPPLRDNLLGYDMLIILMAAGTLAYFIYILRHAEKVHNVLYTQGYLPDDVYDEEEFVPPSKADIKKQKFHLRGMRETTEKYYSMFMNLTGIFPLMGILGTVISLIPLVQNIDDMQANFFVALTSTLWGLVFAVTFRLLDGMLLPRLERNNRGIDEYLEKLENKLEELKAQDTPTATSDTKQQARQAEVEKASPQIHQGKVGNAPLQARQTEADEAPLQQVRQTEADEVHVQQNEPDDSLKPGRYKIADDELQQTPHTPAVDLDYESVLQEDVLEIDLAETEITQ